MRCEKFGFSEMNIAVLEGLGSASSGWHGGGCFYERKFYDSHKTGHGLVSEEIFPKMSFISHRGQL